MAKINLSREKLLVLISPLDWGLGHTTRCIPVIRALLDASCIVVTACNSDQKRILQTEFPQMEFLQLDGYNLRYSRKKWSLPLKLILQIPKMLIAIKREHGWLTQLLRQRAFDLIISDNRYGFYHPSVRSIFITHQLQVRSGLGPAADHILRHLNARRLANFNECWVPDYSGENALAGRLSNPGVKPPVPTFYLGALSRFSRCKGVDATVPLLIILSGPEPQRTMLESIILSQASHLPAGTVLIRGVMKSSEKPSHKQLVIHDHADACSLNELVCRSKLVLSRSGYTTVMDILKLGRRLIAVPTPGQAEQEYLAHTLHQRQLLYAVNQSDLNLPKVLEQVSNYEFRSLDESMEGYMDIIHERVHIKSH